LPRPSQVLNHGALQLQCSRYYAWNTEATMHACSVYCMI